MNEKREVFKTVAFDKEIISDLTKYDALASILLSNLDSIIKYKNARNYVTVIDNNEQSQQLREENCYMFFKGNDYYDIKKIPDHLSLTVDSLWLLTGQPLINICKEKEPASVRIWIKALERGNRIGESHILYWNLKTFDNNDSFSFVKDTSLSKNCIYRIGVATEYD